MPRYYFNVGQIMLASAGFQCTETALFVSLSCYWEIKLLTLCCYKMSTLAIIFTGNNELLNKYPLCFACYQKPICLIFVDFLFILSVINTSCFK